MKDNAKPKVKIMATGGTIAGRGDSPLSTVQYQAGLVPVEDLASAVPGLQDIAELQLEQVFSKASSALSMDDMITLIKRIEDAFVSDPDLHGIVVTHGTDTLEESAFLAHLVINENRPVVFVGAMRPASAISSDGPLNLANAVRVAVDPISRGMGVLVVMNDEIYSARDVSKTNTARLHTFRSLELGPLGFVDGSQICYYHRPLRRHTTDSEFSTKDLANMPRVDIVYSYSGADKELIEAFYHLNCRGLVVAGSGAGSIHPEAIDALTKAKEQGVTVVRSSRTGSGRVLHHPDPRRKDITADNLNPQKARLLLMLALSQTNDTVEIRRIFSQY